MDPDTLNAISDRGWIVILILGAVAAAVAFTTAWSILRSADKPAPTLLVMSLSMLTLLSVVAYVVTGSQEMATLAGVGLGALAAAVSSMFGRIQNIAATAEHMDPAPSPLEAIPSRSPDEWRRIDEGS
jgi:hypothetical protein